MATGTSNGQSWSELRGFTYRVLIVAAVAIVFLFLWEIVQALLFAFMGILLAVLWRGLARLIGRYTHIPARWALIIVTAFVIGLFALFIWFAGPRINEQLVRMSETLPKLVEQGRLALNRYVWGRFVLEHVLPTQLSAGQRVSLFSRITGIASTAVTAVADAVIVLFSAVYFAVNPEPYVKGAISLVPKKKSKRMAQVLDTTAHMLRYWLVGQALAMLLVGTLVAVGLRIAGVPLAFLLGIIAGLLDFVPYIGPVAAAIPGIAIGLTESIRTGVYALIVYVAVQQLENHIIVPLVQRETVWLPPALVILAVVVFGLLFGLLGIVVATPLTAVVVLWVKMLYVHDILGKPARIE